MLPEHSEEDDLFREESMMRKIIEIDETACNGCGLCVAACHEGAIGLVGGKARLLRDDYCDRLGDCLPACPTGAISFVEREASLRRGCGQGRAGGRRPVGRKRIGCREDPEAVARSLPPPSPNRFAKKRPQLSWPVEIKLAPVQAHRISRARTC